MEYSIKKLLSESSVIVEGRKEDARERYPNIPESVFNTFVEDDPSGSHKYLMWLCNKYEEAYSGYRWGFDSSNASDLMELVNYFHEKNGRFEKKDINQYNNFVEFKNEVAEIKSKPTKGELKKDAQKLYETDRYLIVRPTTHATSCYYGAGTRWCTTMKDYSSYFSNYYRDGSLFYFINKNTGKKRAFFTYLRDHFLTPEAVSGDAPNSLGSTQVYTETDSRGRSLRGIPVQGLQVMNEKHEEIRKKHLESLPEDEMVTKMIEWGMELPTNITTYGGDWTDGHYNVIPKQIKKITGNYKTHHKTEHIKVEEVVGNLTINRELGGFGEIERVGGNISSGGYYSWSTDVNNKVESIGKLKYVGGTFRWDNFPNLPLSEVIKIQHIGKLNISRSQFMDYKEELTSKGLSLPGLPGVKIYRDDEV